MFQKFFSFFGVVKNKKSFKFFRYIAMLSFSKNFLVFKKSFLFFDDDG